jgi:DNA-binding transcriptional regulator YhcF (GntR family)
MPDSYPFPIYSGLLEPDHYKKIGSALWLFLWCISSTTKEIERDGITWGIVLGNKPLKRKELADIFDVSERTIQRWLDDLEQHEYIKITRAPYGCILTVKHSKKFQKRVDENVHSDGDETKMSSPEWTEMSNQVDKNVHSNKDITKINNNTTTVTTNDPVDLIADRFADLKSIQEGKRCYPTTDDYQAIAQIVAQGVPSSQTIELLEQCFRDFHERNPKGKIKRFTYCKDYIIEHWQALQAKEEARKLTKRSVLEHGQNNRRSAGGSSPKVDSITGNQVGRLRRKRA